MSRPSRVDSYLDRPSRTLVARRSRPARCPGRSGRSCSPCPELEGHPWRRHPPADTHSVPAPTVTQQPQLRHSPWAVSSSGERGGAQRRGCGADTSGALVFLLAVAPRPELHIARAPFFFRAEGQGCCGQGYLTVRLFSVPS